MNTPKEEKLYEFDVAALAPGSRLDVFLTSLIPDLTRNRAQELIETGQVKINGSCDLKSSHRLKAGDAIRVTVPAARPLELTPEALALDILYEDAVLLVLNKPAGLVIHPAPGHGSGTLVHGLLQHCRDLSGIGGVMRPGIVHRLDKDTSGLVVVAKENRSHLFLSQQFASGRITKKYLALVHGIPRGKSGRIDLPIGRNPRKRKEMSVRPENGKPALTLWEKQETFGSHFSLILARPKTGRTHQIRVHLAHLGHPILGDPVYGFKKKGWKKKIESEKKSLPDIKRQMLHAAMLGFTHPDTGCYCEFTAPLPPDMQEVVATFRTWSDL